MNAHVALLRPAGMPAGMDPKEWRKAVRNRIEELLDASLRLVEALDEMEADCDLEETGDAENWLGWTERGTFGSNTDDESTNEDGGDINDEPEGNDERELDPTDYGETVTWSNDPTIPQEGPRWHGHGIS